MVWQEGWAKRASAGGRLAKPVLAEAGRGQNLLWRKEGKKNLLWLGGWVGKTCPGTGVEFSGGKPECERRSPVKRMILGQQKNSAKIGRICEDREIRVDAAILVRMGQSNCCRDCEAKFRLLVSGGFHHRQRLC